MEARGMPDRMCTSRAKMGKPERHWHFQSRFWSHGLTTAEKCPRHPRFRLGSAERVVITVAPSVIIKTVNSTAVKPNHFEIANNSKSFKSNSLVVDCHLKNNVKRCISYTVITTIIIMMMNWSIILFAGGYYFRVIGRLSSFHSRKLLGGWERERRSAARPRPPISSKPCRCSAL